MNKETLEIKIEEQNLVIQELTKANDRICEILDDSNSIEVKEVLGLSLKEIAKNIDIEEFILEYILFRLLLYTRIGTSPNEDALSNVIVSAYTGMPRPISIHRTNNFFIALPRSLCYNRFHRLIKNNPFHARWLKINIFTKN